MKNIKKILAITLAVLFALSLTACGEKKEETKQETLLVATNAEFEPYESLDADGNCVGFDIDLMNAIGEKLGVKVQYDNMEFDGVVSAVNSGSCDAAISALTINAKRKQSVDFADAYYSGAAQILIVSANDTAFTGTTKEELDAQLKNKKIGVCSGFTGQAYAEGDEDWGFKAIEGAEVKIYDNISLAVADLENGNIEAIVMDDTPAKEAAKDNAKIKVVDVPLTVEEYGIAVQKGNTELLDKINKALAELVSEGKVDELLTKYELN